MIYVIPLVAMVGLIVGWALWQKRAHDAEGLSYTTSFHYPAVLLTDLGGGQFSFEVVAQGTPGAVPLQMDFTQRSEWP